MHDAAFRWALETIEKHRAPLSFRLILTLMKRWRAKHSGDWMIEYWAVQVDYAPRPPAQEE